MISRKPRKARPPASLDNAVNIPLRRAFQEMLMVSWNTGKQLVKSGKLRVHSIGARDYTTRPNIQRCIRLLQKEAR
jgi:hypothetical protein